MKIGVLLRIDSRELIHANRPDSRCESPGHLRYAPQLLPIANLELGKTTIAPENQLYAQVVHNLVPLGWCEGMRLGGGSGAGQRVEDLS